MNEENKFYINNSTFTRFVLIVFLIFFGGLCYLLLGLSLNGFESKDWAEGLEFLLFGGLLLINVIASILSLIHMKAYIEIGNEYITIYKPEKRYSFKLTQYDIYYEEIKWCFFNEIKNLPTQGQTAYKYLFLIKKLNDEYAFITRNDWYGKRSQKGFFVKKISNIEKLYNQLKLKNIKPYDQNVDNYELNKIIQENHHIRMGYNYKRLYFSGKTDGSLFTI